MEIFVITIYNSYLSSYWKYILTITDFLKTVNNELLSHRNVKFLDVQTMAVKFRLAERKNTQANQLFLAGKYSNALYIYESAIELCPTVAKYYCNMSACYMNIGDYIKAQSQAQKAIELDPKYLKAYSRILKCCLVTGNIKYASSILQKALKIFPTNEELLECNETVNFLQKNFQNCHNELERNLLEQALESINKCIEKQPNCTLFIVTKGKCLIRLQKYVEAKEIADKILKTNKSDEDAMFIQTCAQCYQVDVKAALPLIRKLKQILPDHPQVTKLFNKTTVMCNNVAKIEAAIQSYNYEEAYKLVKETLKLDRNYTITNRRLFLRKIDVTEADEKLHWACVKECGNYMSIYGKNLIILKTRVNIYMKLLEYEDAISDYEEIIVLEENEENEANLNEAKQLFNDQVNDDHKILKLKLTRKPSKIEINKAALDLKKVYHPDKHAKATPERVKQLEGKMIRVKSAEERLLKKS